VDRLRTVAPEPGRHEVVSWSPPYERDGVMIITATATRAHTAVRRGRGPRGLDAEMSGARPLGAFVVRGGEVRWRPAVDLTRVLTTAQWVVGAVLVAERLARRPSGAKAAVTMGPGGWVSMKGGAMAVRPADRLWRTRRPAVAPAIRTRRPWWARLLAAVTLDSLVR
jgi:hypothetical protein